MLKLSIRSTVLSILGMLLLATSSASAVETFKTSFHGVGVQLWFEVEDFDERSPVDDDSVFELSDEPGAFGRSIVGHDPSPDGSGFIRYTFNISEAGGAGGTWQKDIGYTLSGCWSMMWPAKSQACSFVEISPAAWASLIPSSSSPTNGPGVNLKCSINSFPLISRWAASGIAGWKPA